MSTQNGHVPQINNEIKEEKKENGCQKKEEKLENGAKEHNANGIDKTNDSNHKFENTNSNSMTDKVDTCKLSNGSTEFEKKNNILALPRHCHRLSFMEQESAREKARLNLLTACSAILKQNDDRFTKESLHRTFQDEELLHNLFLLFDVDRRGYLLQDDWIKFLKERLTEENQLDFVEQVESVAYVLCADDAVSPDVFHLILRNKVVTTKLFKVVDTDADGYVSADEVMQLLSTITSSRARVGFDEQSVVRLEQLFKQTVGDRSEINMEQFQKILLSKNAFFTKRVFEIFDEDRSGAISLQEFIAAVHRFAGQTPDDKIRFLFKVYDEDGDGLIQHSELHQVMRACMHENGMSFSEDQLLELTAAMIEDADTEQRGAITYEALKHQLNEHEGLLENLTISIDRWLVPPKAAEAPKTLCQKMAKLKPYQLSKPYFKNNYVFLTYLAFFSLVNIGLFVSRSVDYWETGNGYLILARACGQCLNFNCAWVLVLMLRHCITQLRVRGFSSLLPLDHHIYLHKLAGVLIAVYSAVHTVMHLCNFSIIVINHPVINANNYTLAEWLLTERPGLFGLVPGCANPTGVALAVILTVMFVCSQPFIRRGGSFEIFYWTHLLYVPFWLLLLFHGPNFWKWFVLPGTVYVVERIMRVWWMRTERGKSYISSGILLPSKVTHLVVKRPPHFDFHAGDYVFINIPAIATYEWHPFTISSAPEHEDHVWLHIRGVGQWTNRLYSYFEQQQERLHKGDLTETNEHEKVSRTNSSQSRKSRKSSSGSLKKRSVDFSPGFTNDAFSIEEEPDKENGQVTSSPLPAARPALLSPHRLLEKSPSLPLVQTSNKLRLLALRDSMRSESEHVFDSSEMQRARVKALGLAYKSPQNRALAHSFRYMRIKPTIIAFKTPSLEDWERRRSNESILSIARRRLSKTLSPEKDVESAAERPSIHVISPSVSSDDDSFENYPIGKPLEIYLDGPYGAASSHIFRAQHAVLIAAGIGVTPFASILQSIMYRYWAARNECPKCKHTWTSMPQRNMGLKKVDFFWINREQRSFEWFVSLLSALEIEQAEEGAQRFLEMHMYITSALQPSDMKAVLLQLAMDLLHQKEKRDLITGLKTRTNAGRPNWDIVFKKLREQNNGKVTVFYCGPPQLAKILRVKCDQFGFAFRKEVF